MYEYVKGKAMYANITSPNTRFEPHKYGITVLTDSDTATKLEDLGLNGTANHAPKLVDSDGKPMDVAIGNGSEVTVKIKPYKNNYGRFAELMAVKVDNLIEYTEQDSDNEEF